MCDKVGVKTQIEKTSRGKITWTRWSFCDQIDTVKRTSRSRGKLCLQFQITGVNSQSSKKRGKITIRYQNKGINANDPSLKIEFTKGQEKNRVFQFRSPQYDEQYLSGEHT